MSAKKKIEAIYPLIPIQQALLIHALSAEEDQGVLQVQSLFTGKIDIEVLRTAWKELETRHPFLRASVHWEKIKKPVMVVHPSVDGLFDFKDLSTFSEDGQQKEIDLFLISDRKKSFDFTKPPLSRCVLFKLGENEFYFIWSCHHILYDGWSTSVVFEDLSKIYNNILSDQKENLPFVADYKSYLKWENGKDEQEAKAFWTKYLSGFSFPTSVVDRSNSNPKSHFDEMEFEFSEDEKNQLKVLAQKKKVSLNTLMMGLWGLILARLNDRLEAMIGVTVVGRSPSIPGIDRTIGLFSNVVPFRMQIQSTWSIEEWLHNIQDWHKEMIEYEHSTLDKISSWIEWSDQSPLVNNLFVSKSFPWQGIHLPHIQIDRFFGGVTSSYPLTCIIEPGTGIKCVIRFDREQVSNDLSNWLIDQFNDIGKRIGSNEYDNIGLIYQEIVPFLREKKSEEERPEHSLQAGQLSLADSFVPPTNELEFQLSNVWEQVFNIKPIGIHHNFFELGGKSITAIRLFAEMERKIGMNMSPAILLQKPTIAELAEDWGGKTAQESWSSIVSLEPEGTRPPIFCVHGGGGHVFFYKLLAESLPQDQPVFALQPRALGGLDFDLSIKGMSRNYIADIVKMFPEGPIALLGYCFSAATCHEMAKQLKEMGREVSMLVVIDSAPRSHKGTNGPPLRPEYLKACLQKGQVVKMIRHVMQVVVQDRIMLPKKNETKQERNLRKMVRSLERIYWNYNWTPGDHKVVLIRSSEFAQNPVKDYHLSSWKILGKGGLETYTIESRHYDLFTEPAVFHMAEALNAALEKANLAKSLHI